MNNPFTVNRLAKADRELDAISSKISFYAINPINVEEEKTKFFASKDYQPQFKYASYREDLAKLRRRISMVKTDKTVVGEILEGIKNSYIDKTYLLEYRGNNEQFTKYSKKIYGFVPKKLKKIAEDFMAFKQEKEKPVFSSKQVVRKFRIAFLKYGFPWNVSEKEMIANAAVKINTNEIFIKKDTWFSKRFVKRLIVHEIGTHVARAENGGMQPYLFFKRGLPGYLMIEEGLAVLNEELNNCSNKYILKLYAGRVLAVDYALKKGFRETFNELNKYFSKEISFRLTLRAKRGLSDTSLPGACTKDINYLKGYIALKDFIRDGGDLSKLYYGKIGLEHINLLDKVPGLINPAFLPVFRHVNYLIHHFSSLLRTMILFPLTPLRTINSKIYKKLVE